MGIRNLDGNNLVFDGKYMSKEDGKTRKWNANWCKRLGEQEKDIKKRERTKRDEKIKEENVRETC